MKLKGTEPTEMYTQIQFFELLPLPQRRPHLVHAVPDLHSQVLHVVCVNVSFKNDIGGHKISVLGLGRDSSLNYMILSTDVDWIMVIYVWYPFL